MIVEEILRMIINIGKEETKSYLLGENITGFLEIP